MKIIGSYVSPYVRKVLACLALKDIVYEIDPITRAYADARVQRIYGGTNEIMKEVITRAMGLGK
jgi:alkylation response protein AidB-like acyl-CoA dehydrogenase